MRDSGGAEIGRPHPFAEAPGFGKLADGVPEPGQFNRGCRIGLIHAVGALIELCGLEDVTTARLLHFLARLGEGKPCLPVGGFAAKIV